MSPRVYLAGPDVFFPDAEAWAERRKAICAGYGLVAVSPLDRLADERAAWSVLPEWQRIAWRNEAHIRACEAVIANLTPFRGPSADVGTVYEVGFARAMGRVVFGYTNSAAQFTQRTLDYASAHGGAIASPGRIWRDGDGLLIEQFRRFDNLMIESGILASGGALVVPKSDPADRWRDLVTFESCVRLASTSLYRAAGEANATTAQTAACAAGTPAPRGENRSSAAPATTRR
jgi:nucleoside 2-deoxyribosyltransferase